MKVFFLICLLVVVAFWGILIGIIVGKRKNTYKILNERRTTDKYKGYYAMLIQWLEILQNKSSIYKYFKENKYDKIAIYGIGEVGKRLMCDLNNTEVFVKYAIDSTQQSSEKLRIYKLSEVSDDVDVVIVTPIFAFDKIKKDLKKIFTCPIVSLEEVIYDIEI